MIVIAMTPLPALKPISPDEKHEWDYIGKYRQTQNMNNFAGL